MDKIEDVCKLDQLKKLRTMIVSENPFIEKFQGNSFNFLVNKFNRLKRLNKKVLTIEIRNDVIEYEKKLFFEELANRKNTSEDKE
jgi:diacylglycerol kinase family enzyme